MVANEIGLDDLLRNNPKADNVDPNLRDLPTLVRWYIDTREWAAKGLDLPLLEALRPDMQEAVKRYHHAADKRMSLASHLLKYLYIHHVCGIPWKDIVFSRTDPPEGRPYYDCHSPRVEFNVSHQASLTILAGTIAPNKDQLEKLATANIPPLLPRLGIDITCVNERKPITSFAELRKYVEIFSEVFSPSELYEMSNPHLTLNHARKLGFAKTYPEEDGYGSPSEDTIVRFGLRLFYSYWALKEAYVKMTGEALLAPWLRDLEFTNVIPPDPVDPLIMPRPHGRYEAHDIPQSAKNWGVPYRNVVVSRNGQRIDDVRIQLVAFESDYIVATVGSGCPVGALSQVVQNADEHHWPGQIEVPSPGSDPKPKRIPLSAKKVIGDMDPWNVPYAITDPWLPMQEVDIDLDVRACAEGRCSHPSDHKSILPGVESHRSA